MAEPNVVAGIGAAAGGLKALQQLFEHMLASSGMAFVVSADLGLEQEHSLAQLLQAHTAMPVVAATGLLDLQPNHVYILPPDRQIQLQDGTIRLVPPEQPQGQPATVDRLFRTLGEAYGPRAAAIILSGNGASGTLGLLRVKELGGITLVQDLNEAQYEGMPQSAIATGLVDAVLPVAQMPERLLAFAHGAGNASMQEQDDGLSSTASMVLSEILAILRARTGHAFDNYTHSTLLRRIRHRLAIHNLQHLADYPAVLRETPKEVGALLRDCLVSVSNFFRDPAAFAALESMIPLLFVGKGPSNQVRVWVAACATGEEAYSIAMLLAEYAARLEHPPSIQVFATDVNEEAITLAREGLYIETIAGDLSPERLQRFFTREQGHYRVKKKLRDLVLFAVHNLLRDPPFSKLDLISCRNLLVSLNHQAQQHTLALFHFALRPPGYLFLGAADPVDAEPALFSALDKRHNIFERSHSTSRPHSLPELPRPNGPRQDLIESRAARLEHGRLLSELHQELLASYAPASVLINAALDIVHLSARATRWLQFSGEPSFNLLRVAHPALRVDLRNALFAATQGNQAHAVHTIQAALGDTIYVVNLHVQPLHSPDWAAGLILVVFEEVSSSNTGTLRPNSDEERDAVQQLEAGNQRIKEQLRATLERFETITEELKASNDQLHATAEELEASNEELETSKEELQSVNEELKTVNSELKQKIEEYSSSNSDLQNLLVATDIATIFLDRSLRITRYTPRIHELFNLLPSDLHRSLGHVTHKLDYEHVLRDAATVLEQQTTIELEVRSHNDRWYLARLLPYRSQEDMISGVVITFIEITQRKQIEKMLRHNDERFRLLYQHVHDYAIFSIDPNGSIQDWNIGAQRIFGYASAEIIGQPVDLLFTPEDIAAGVPAGERRTAQREGRAEDERWHLRRGGVRIYISGVTTALSDPGGGLRGFLKIGRDMTEQRQAEEQLRQAYGILEQHVAERTAALSDLNIHLEQAMAERQRAEQERERVRRQLMTAQEEERRRISRELHDQTGQQLAALQLALRELEGVIDEHPRALGPLGKARNLASLISRDLHQLALRLRPTTLDDLGLEAALATYAEAWAKEANVLLDVYMSGLSGQRLPEEVSICVYRIVQEALTNIFKHAHAHNVSLIVERRAHELVAVVEDNGRGFDTEATRRMLVHQQRLGLLGMHERAALLNGTLTIDSVVGRGTTVVARLPIGDEDAEDGNGEHTAASGR